MNSKTLLLMGVTAGLTYVIGRATFMNNCRKGINEALKEYDLRIGNLTWTLGKGKVEAEVIVFD